mgnify:CR=1 FL=1
MADITHTSATQGSLDAITWATLTSSNAAGNAYEPNGTKAGIATAHFTGTFDSATAVLQGSNDGTNWLTLLDTTGAAISMTATGYAELSTAFAYIRPRTYGGGGSQDSDCILVARG